MRYVGVMMLCVRTNASIEYHDDAMGGRPVMFVQIRNAQNSCNDRECLNGVHIGWMAPLIAWIN